MTVEEISRYASMGTLPDKELNCPERCLFYGLRDVYQMHKENRITRAQGEQEKEKLIKRYRKELGEFNFSKMYLLHQGKFWKAIEEAGIKYRKQPSIENADVFIEAVYGVGRVKDEEGK